MGVLNTFIVLLLGFVIGFEVGANVMRNKLRMMIDHTTKELNLAAETMRRMKQEKEQTKDETAETNN